MYECMHISMYELCMYGKEYENGEKEKSMRQYGQRCVSMYLSIYVYVSEKRKESMRREKGERVSYSMRISSESTGICMKNVCMYVCLYV